MSAYTLGSRVLTVEGVSLSLPKEDGSMRLILRDINFAIDDIVSTEKDDVRGQVVGILGPSGIGKTQLLKMLAGLLKPSSGQILINTEQRPVRKGDVGVVAQDYPLLMHRTVRENLVLAGKLHGFSEKDSQALATQWLETIGLQVQSDLYPARLSGGQRQRVAITQQLICSDHYILFDEPFSGLDPISMAKVIKLITEMANNDELNTFVVITHDLSAAVKACDRLILIGHEKDDNDKIISGATVMQDYNLIDLGLAWNPDVEHTREYAEFVSQLKLEFRKLDYGDKRIVPK